jgi:alternate signal-mediated exported protein
VFRKSVLNAAAAASAGAGILLVTGLPHAFGSVDAGAPIAPGSIKVEAVESAVAASGDGAGDELVVVPGETVTFTTTARVTVQGEGLSAVLRLDTSELFAVAPEPLRGELDAAVDVELHGLTPADGPENAWLVPARSEPYDVTAVVSVEMPDLDGAQGQDLSTGELTWSVTQTSGGGGPR